MRFGRVPLDQAEGAMLAHSLSEGTLRLKKGHLLTRSDVMLLAQGGVENLIVARLDPGDAGEDEAARTLGDAIAGSHIRAGPASTGRVNLFATKPGLFRADRLMVDDLNGIDPAITFACLADRTQVDAGDMVATIKIIPLAVAAVALKKARTTIAAPGLVRVAAFKPVRAGLIATKLPQLKQSVMTKTRDLLVQRLLKSGSRLVEEARVAHDSDAVAAEIARLGATCDMIIIFGASAVTDAEDVIPAAIRMAGGTVERIGMPVDPGNLLVLGSVGQAAVIGAPGCARSPRENGFDWVLARMLAGETPTARDISRMGVGGLLKEIHNRPQPRQGTGGGKDGGPAVGAVLLAAGRASRMGESAGHKLLAQFDGEPLVRRMATVALGSKAAQTAVVTGHRADDVAAALAGLDVDVVDNPAYGSGMASSLKAGLGALNGKLAGALVLLGDMPALTSEHLDRLIAAFGAAGGGAIVRACDGERRGNPVILPRAAFDDAMALSGDVGARTLVESGIWPVRDIDIGPAARLDVDTPEAVRGAGGTTERGA